MIFMVLALAGAPIDTNQIMSGKAFDIFADATDRQCPDKSLRDIKPEDLNFWEQRYYASLSPDQQKQLDDTNNASKVCSSRNGASCTATETLDAIERTGTLDPFVSFACAQ